MAGLAHVVWRAVRRSHLGCARSGASDSLAHRCSLDGTADLFTGISSKDAIVTALTGSTSKGKDHATAAKELKQALGKRPEAPTAEKTLRELLSAKGDVEYGVALVTAVKAESLVRRARTLLGLAVQIVRLGR